MKILTAIGEMGVWVGDKQVRFRPSLHAMAQIGDPATIVETFVAVCGQPPATGNPWLDEPRAKRWRRAQFDAAVTVLHCCADEDVSGLVGYVNERMRYTPGKLPLNDIVGLAIGLLKHGVMGDVPVQEMPAGTPDSYTNEFKARDFVATAMAHLGATEQEAWDMTMTGFICAMRSKYPIPDDAKQAPTEEEHDHMMSWLDRVNAARKLEAEA